MPGILLYPDTKHEVEVLLDEDNYPIMYRVNTEDSEWATPQGIRVGSTLTELIAANGKDFKFFGFDWDYGGTVTNWQDGKFEDQGLLIRLGYEGELDPHIEANLAMIGDQEVSTTLPVVQAHDIRVIEIAQRY